MTFGSVPQRPKLANHKSALPHRSSNSCSGVRGKLLHTFSAGLCIPVTLIGLIMITLAANDAELPCASAQNKQGVTALQEVVVTGQA
jgi:hypothetical protein